MTVALTAAVELLTTPSTLDGMTGPVVEYTAEDALLQGYTNGDAVTSLADVARTPGYLLAGAAGPTLRVADDMNGWGFPSLEFNGTSHVLSLAGMSNHYGASGIGCTFVVVRADIANTGPVFCQGRTDGRRLVIGATCVAANYDGSEDLATISADYRGAYRIFMLRHSTVDAKVYAGAGAAAAGLDTSSLVGTTTGAADFTGTDTLYVGSNSSTTFFKGNLVALLFFNYDLTQAQRRQVVQHLRKRHGIPEDQDNTGLDWVALTDVLGSQGIQCSYGLSGSEVGDRVADTGSMSFSLNNSEVNSAGLAGYYSPGHANHWTPFDLGTEVRLKLTYAAVSYYKWRGVIDSISVQPGARAAKRVDVTCVDWMDQAAQAQVTSIPLQLGKRSDQILSTLLSRMVTPPPARSIGFGADTYAYALDNSEEEATVIMGEFQRLAASELGFVYARGDTTRGGVLCFESRMKRGQKTIAVMALDADSLTGLDVSYTRDDITNEALVQIFPRRVDTAATSVLFTLQEKPQVMRGTTQAVFCPFRDPSSGRFVRVGGTDMVQPVSTTDYTFFQNDDGTGTDYTSQLDVSAVYGASGATITVTNNGPWDGYLTKLQVRGKGVYSAESTVYSAADATSQARYGKRTVRFDMPYQSSSAVGQDAAQYILSQGRVPRARLRTVSFFANRTGALMLAALAREISDRVTVTEAVTAVGEDYFINRVELNITDGPLIHCSWSMAPADMNAYWLLEADGFTELDLTTSLAYGLFAPQWQLDVSQLGVDTIVNAV